MKVLAIFLFWVVTCPLNGQERYAYAYLNPAQTSRDFILKLESYEKVKAYGLLENKGLWIIFDDTIPTIKNWFKQNNISLEVLALNLRYGHSCLDLQPNENTSLTFIKYSSYITKFNVQDSPRLFRLHDEHIKEINKTGNILLEGFFDNNDGGILIMKGSLEKEVILSDGAVRNGIIEAEINQTAAFVGIGCEN